MSPHVNILLWFDHPSRWSLPNNDRQRRKHHGRSSPPDSPGGDVCRTNDHSACHAQVTHAHAHTHRIVVTHPSLTHARSPVMCTSDPNNSSDVNNTRGNATNTYPSIHLLFIYLYLPEWIIKPAKHKVLTNILETAMTIDKHIWRW
jgi:hypothetical protein